MRHFNHNIANNIIFLYTTRIIHIIHVHAQTLKHHTDNII